MKNKSGMTLVEMTVGMLLASVVISGAYKLQTDITRSVERERDKSILLAEILNTGRVIERDIRSSGYGLPGNGLLRVIVGGNEELFLFTNSTNVSAEISSAVNAGADLLSVDAADEFYEGDWVCIENDGAITYYQVTTVNNNLNEIRLQSGVGSDISAATKIYRAEARRYYVDPDNESLYREANGNIMKISERIGTINLIPRDKNGTDVIISPDLAQTIEVTIGGTYKVGGQEQLYTESTEVYIRN